MTDTIELLEELRQCGRQMKHGHHLQGLFKKNTQTLHSSRHLKCKDRLSKLSNANLFAGEREKKAYTDPAGDLHDNIWLIQQMRPKCCAAGPHLKMLCARVYKIIQNVSNTFKISQK